jgi:hypothetical protein
MASTLLLLRKVGFSVTDTPKRTFARDRCAGVSRTGVRPLVQLADDQGDRLKSPRPRGTEMETDQAYVSLHLPARGDEPSA